MASNLEALHSSGCWFCSQTAE